MRLSVPLSRRPILAWCRIQLSALIAMTATMTGTGRSRITAPTLHPSVATQCRQRRVTRDRRRAKPEHCEDKTKTRIECGKSGDAGGDTLAALKSQPDRETMPDHRDKAGKADQQWIGRENCHEQHDSRALAAVENQRQKGKRLASRPKNIGSADIAASDGTDVAFAGKSREEKAEGIEPAR